MDATPGFPTPIGVLRAVDAPRYETLVARADPGAVAERKGKGDLDALLRTGDTWEVRLSRRRRAARFSRRFFPLTAETRGDIFEAEKATASITRR